MLGEANSFFVYTRKGLGGAIKDSAQLARATKRGLIARVAHHFVIDELRKLFPRFKVEYQRVRLLRSPRSQWKLRSVVLVMRKMGGILRERVSHRGKEVPSC